MVTVEHEPDSFGPWLERCCVCRERTPYWTVLPDRTPGQQVACCQSCAKTVEPHEVPTKREWCDKERRLTRTVGEM